MILQAWVHPVEHPPEQKPQLNPQVLTHEVHHEAHASEHSAVHDVPLHLNRQFAEHASALPVPQIEVHPSPMQFPAQLFLHADVHVSLQ